MGGGYGLVWYGTNHSKKNMYFRAWFVPDEARFVLLAKSPIYRDTCDHLFLTGRSDMYNIELSLESDT